MARNARLTDPFIEQDTVAVMSKKLSLQEQFLLLKRDAAVWLEPMQEWIQEAQALGSIAQKQRLPQKLFGSNLTLHAREARGIPQNQWLSLVQAKQEIPISGDFQGVVRREGFEPSKAVPSRLQRDLVDHLSTDAFSLIFFNPVEYLLQ